MTTNQKLSAIRKMASGKRMAVLFLALTTILIAATSSPTKDNTGKFTVVLDAGHGGKDPGNLGTGRHKTTEKDISLDVTLELGKLIKEHFPDVNIVYTRDKDAFPSLKERVDIANNHNADLFISVHCNANDNKGAYGSETFVMGLHKSEESLKTAMKENASIFLEDNTAKDYAGFDPNNPDTYIALSLRENIFLDQSLNLAKQVQDQFRSRIGRKDRGVKQAGYYVISFTNMPSVLIELGFLTNAEEEDFLQSKDGKSYMASAIFRAFRDYKSKIELKNENGSVTEQSNPPTEIVKVNTPAAEKTAMDQNIIWREVPTGIIFQVQILTTTKKLDKKAPDFKGLTRCDEVAANGSYKYMAGATASFKEAKQNQQALRDMGFKDAFIVAFENGKRIDLNLAIEKTK